jgi:hypothetical protein
MDAEMSYNYEIDNKDIYSSIKKNNNKRTYTNNNKNPKKFKNDNDLINKLLDGEMSNVSSENSDSYENKIECINPLCDHKDYSKHDQHLVVPEMREINSIDDLIELGKLYHCKKNKEYYGINLRLLCSLVEPLTKLKNMIGMKSVKESMINQIIFFLQGFNQKGKCNECMDCVCGLSCTKNLNNDMLHTVITGPPGVGKTELGKILGQVYKAMGVLSKGHMHIASRSDLVGKYLGHTAQKTQSFIDKCRGGVMFIDEAYSLGNPEGRDSFSKECLDTINQNLSERRDFLCIIAGYADALDNNFFQYNEGLKRRFTYRYDIQGYTSDELMEIFLSKIKLDGWSTDFDVDDGDSLKTIRYKEQRKQKVKDFFKKNKRYFPHFGGDIESFLLNCKVVHGKRVLFLDQEYKKVYSLYDIEKGLKTFVSNRKYNESVDGIVNIESVYQY